MRKLLLAFAGLALTLSAQYVPKNLKVLKPEQVQAAMGLATQGLGFGCANCHATPDMASDEKMTKVIARAMFAMVAEINAKFPDGKVHVTCYTCHRGQSEPAPATAPPTQ